MDRDKTYCACSRVSFDPEKLDNGMMRERWRCQDCGTVFAKQVLLPANAAERKHSLICSMASTLYASGDYSHYRDVVIEAREIDAEATRQEEESRG